MKAALPHGVNLFITAFALAACESSQAAVSHDAAPDVTVDALNIPTDTPRVEEDRAVTPDLPATDASACARDEQPCDGRCIPQGSCCGLPESGLEWNIDARYDDRRVTVSERSVLTTENGYDLRATSALVEHAGRLWFTHASRACNGARTVAFEPSADGTVTRVEARCESVGSTVTAVSLSRDAEGLVGCFSNPVRGAEDTLRCGRWSAGPGTWTPRGPSHRVIAAQWFDSADRPFASWSVRDQGDVRLSVARFDADLNITRESVLGGTADTLRATTLAGEVRWFLRRSPDTARAPVLERLHGDVWLPPYDLGTFRRIMDWDGALASAGEAVALAVQTPHEVLLFRADARGVRGRRVHGNETDGQGALVAFEDGWLYVGHFHYDLWLIRMDCAGRIREAPRELGYHGSRRHFAGLARGLDARSFWVLGIEDVSGTQRTVTRVSW